MQVLVRHRRILLGLQRQLEDGRRDEDLVPRQACPQGYGRRSDRRPRPRQVHRRRDQRLLRYTTAPNYPRRKPLAYACPPAPAPAPPQNIDRLGRGSAAGGLATFLHVDHWASVLTTAAPKAKVRGMPDSGFCESQRALPILRTISEREPFGRLLCVATRLKGRWCWLAAVLDMDQGPKYHTNMKCACRCILTDTSPCTAVCLLLG